MDNILKGRLTVDRTLSGKFISDFNLRGVISTLFEMDHYTGDYVITPKAKEEQVLETANKIVERNITVNRVPYHETSNTYGETVYIGSEV